MPPVRIYRSLRHTGRTVAAAILLAALAGCEEPALEHQAIIGTWKSNEKLTLMSVDRVEMMSPQTRAFLRDDFFGHLVIDIRENK